MAAIAQPLEGSGGRLAWLWPFLWEELRPYRGRGTMVVRIVIATTLMMIVAVTFQIPYAAYGAVYALTLSRESVEATTSAVRIVAVSLVLAGAYAIFGALLVLGEPAARFLWVVGTLFLIFYAMSALNNYAGVSRFGYLIVVTIPLWDSQIPAGQKVTGTLWAIAIITLGSYVTLLLEIAFAAFKKTDDLMEGISNRLEYVEALLRCHGETRALDPDTQSQVTRLATVGTSRLRRILRRANYNPLYAEQMAAVVGQAGRLVDLAANLSHLSGPFQDADCMRFHAVAENLARIRSALLSGAVPSRIQLPEGASTGPPLLREIEKTVALIPEIFTGASSLDRYGALPAGQTRSPIIPPWRKLAAPEHLKFGLRGCLAASLCYFIYNALFWRGLSTSVVTCLLTALTTVGSSRQKQFLRFSGAIVGGVLIGMGSQIFVLPYIDSIAGFTMLFAAVAVLSAWLATSSARFSYFGVQVFVAFCLVNLQEFKIQTSLTVARDRVLGILLGLFMMWLVFDRLWSVPAGVAMKRAFVETMRLLAALFREPASADYRASAVRMYALRDAINAQFAQVRPQADGALFEFGASRSQNLLLRDRIRRWQPQLRTLFIMRTASLKYPLRLQGFELPEDVLGYQRTDDGRVASLLEVMADRVEGSPIHTTPDAVPPPASPQPAENVQSFLTLQRAIDELAASLAEEFAAELA